MQDERKLNVPLALYQASLDEAIQSYMGKFQPDNLESTMESRAIRTLEAIRQILDDTTYNDPECFERIDALVMLFFRELGVNIDRHSEFE